MRRALLAGALAALALPAFAHAAPITTGHIDALDVDYAGGVLSLDIRDARTATVNDDLDPATAELYALPASQTSVPGGSGWAFLGTPGSPVWILPQSLNPALLWPGWNTENVGAGLLVGDGVTLRLEGVSGPGRFALYTTSAFGAPTVRFNSGDGLPDALAVARNVHAHANWAFTAAGTYTVGFRAVGTAIGGLPKDSGLKTYRFVVQ